MKILNSIVRVGIAALLMVGGTPRVFSGDSDGLPRMEILKRVQQKYAALSSYADTGTIVTEIEGMRSQTGTFRIKLSRSDRYRIEWEQFMPVRTGVVTNRNAIWSAGEGEYCLLTGFDKYYRLPEKVKSGTLYSPVPEMFFTAANGGGFWKLSAQPSELSMGEGDRVNGVDCQVLKGKVDDVAVTLWIGKEDSLIHQIRRVKEGGSGSGKNIKITDSMVTEALKRANERQTPENKARMKAIMQKSAAEAQSVDRQARRRTTTETHERIRTNERLTDADFNYPVPAGVVLSETFP